MLVTGFFIGFRCRFAFSQFLRKAFVALIRKDGHFVVSLFWVVVSEEEDSAGHEEREHNSPGEN